MVEAPSVRRKGFFWWMSAGPGLGMFLAELAFNFLGDALRDALDPRLRRSA